MRAAVMGSGAWGTTFAAVLADAGAEVTLWGRRDEVRDEINEHHTNGAFLPGVILPSAIRATTDAASALEGVDLVAVAVPAQNARSIVADWKDAVPSDAVVMSLMKGIEVGTGMRMSEVLAEVLGLTPSRTAVLSGPNLAKEIAAKQPTATVIACEDEAVAERLAAATASAYFRPYINTDVVGVELCGAIKNIIAVAVGITDGRGYGHNTTATVITRGLAEIQRLGMSVGSRAETFSGLAGMGDLIATCASPLSRNHSLGSMIGQGKTLDEAVALAGGVAEGVKSSQSVQALAARAGVEMPICDAVVAMLHEGEPIDTVMGALLSRPRKAEGQ